ncbi:unnamed protein product [Nezara viridula]|uniref:Uncharacterized protein n=1 Tax=Nezara viridula TaxID=85310 RepID=A0A9P0MSI0_NEZVI|nr:unnamed protein product [Nezara viridula]
MAGRQRERDEDADRDRGAQVFPLSCQRYISNIIWRESLHGPLFSTSSATLVLRSTLAVRGNCSHGARSGVRHGTSRVPDNLRSTSLPICQ